MRIEVSGVWDMLHVGHVRLFERARQLAPAGEQVTLLVGVHSDETVASYKRRPIIPHRQRAEMVGSCRGVDGVILDAPLVVTESYIKKHGIDLLVHAHGPSDTSYDAFYQEAINLGKFRRLDYSPSTSTSDIIERVCDRGYDVELT
tara:strand:- start:202 stop:639 length:438 start_codon:yes stop_codon:yes gene_type:complete